MGSLVPQPGIEPMPPIVKAWSPNHWTTREFPINSLNPHNSPARQEYICIYIFYGQDIKQNQQCLVHCALHIRPSKCWHAYYRKGGGQLWAPWNQSLRGRLAVVRHWPAGGLELGDLAFIWGSLSNLLVSSVYWITSWILSSRAQLCLQTH